MKRITFTVATVPIAQPRPRAFAMAGRARVYGADKRHPIHEFKASVRMAAQAAYDGAPLDGPLSVMLAFSLPRPGRLRWKRREMPRCWHMSKPDVENLAKGALDALNAILWRDDGQIAKLAVVKCYAAGDEQPAVSVTVETLEVEGLTR